MNEMQFPPAGTRCGDCGCCEAKLYAGNAPICWACDEGVPCKGKTAPPAKPVAAAEPVPAALAPDVPASEKTPKPERAKRHQGRKITDAMKERIHTADPGIAHAALARELGISDMSVRLIRQRAGIQCTATRWAPVKREQPAQAAAAVKPAARPVELAAPVVAAKALQVCVSLSLDEASVDAYWRGLNLEQKAAMVELQLRAILLRA